MHHILSLIGDQQIKKIYNLLVFYLKQHFRMMEEEKLHYLLHDYLLVYLYNAAFFLNFQILLLWLDAWSYISIKIW